MPFIIGALVVYSIVCADILLPCSRARMDEASRIVHGYPLLYLPVLYSVSVSEAMFFVDLHNFFRS